MRYAWIPPGAFLMGGEANPREKPLHRVTIRKGFYLGIIPVTQAQWRSVMGYNPSKFPGADRPVEMVSWDDCRACCQKLTQLTGKPIRLPTEAEWEYACRAGGNSEYHTGDGEDSLRRAGWFKGNSDGQTHPVGKLPCNAWNLFDMHGGVWEWCSDWFVEGYETEHQVDPAGPASGERRVVRGGAWDAEAAECRSAYRGRILPGNRYNDCGFRVCFCPD
jgi:formylglycine-generating enzyme required for sulfatase activity